MRKKVSLQCINCGEAYRNEYKVFSMFDRTQEVWETHKLRKKVFRHYKSFHDKTVKYPISKVFWKFIANLMLETLLIPLYIIGIFVGLIWIPIDFLHDWIGIDLFKKNDNIKKRRV